MNQLPKIPLSLSQAIARQEGWYAATESDCTRNNNPGNIEAGRFARAHGATGSDGKFAIFPDAEHGFTALQILLHTSGYYNDTIEGAISKYAPSNENNTQTYIENVCLWMCVHPSTLVSAVRI